jgi:2-phospho-L-lactate transferase/gluconeogenesis factor (CofD/UPF0052 family)
VTKRIPTVTVEYVVTRRIAVLGGAHGLVSLLRPVRDDSAELTVMVTTADHRGSPPGPRRRVAGPAVGDLQRSLVTFTADDVASGRHQAVGNA